MDEENKAQERPEISDPELPTPGETPEEESKREEPKKESWWQRHKPTKRRLIQVYAALLVNANIKGFFTGRIYKGATKNFCVPGLNCYSCPGAVGACPLGALQNALAASDTRAPFYVIGILVLFGLLLGRTICGFLCPVGLGQELLYKIKTPKVKKNRVTRVLSYLKYVILAVFAVGIPLVYATNSAVPGFCKYICPAGTFGGALFLLIHPDNADLYAQLGPLFTWKFCLMVAILVGSVFFFRFFCRFFCPLGAIYGFFNKIAMLGVKLDKNKCTDCGLCVSHCKMDIKHVGDHECINCGECIAVCPAKAISWKGSKLLLHPNAAAEGVPAPSEERPLFEHVSPIQTGTEAVNDMQEVQTENNETPQPAKKQGRGRNFWIQVAAWGVALAVLVGAFMWYNFIPSGDTTGNDGPTVNLDPPDGGDREPGNKVGDLCYNFAVKCYKSAGNVKEEDVFTLSEHRGEIVFVDFWYTECGPCLHEMPEINRLAEEYKITVIAIHGAYFYTKPANMEGVQAWLDDESRNWDDYRIIFAQDAGNSLDDSASYYSILGGKDAYPMNMLIDAEGVVTYKKQGPITYETMTAELEKLHAEKR